MNPSQVHDAELNVIRCVLDSRGFEGSVHRGLKGEHFRDADYGKAWEYLRDHYQKFGTVPAIETFLKDHPDLREFLMRSQAVEPPEFYADKILEGYTRHGIATKLTEILPTLESDVAQGMEEISHAVSEYRLIRSSREVLSLANTGRERLDAYNKATVYGVSYGWDTLDDATLGAHPGDLAIFAARPKAGKTMINLYNAHRAWTDDRRILIIATEVPAIKMLQRFDAIHMGFDYELFKKRMLETRVVKAYEQFLLEEHEANERLNIVDGTGMTPSALGVLIEQTEPDIVYIDSVHKLEPDGKYRERWMKMAHLANELKDQVAQRHQIPVICNTHFNREVGTFGSKGKQLEGGLENIAGGDEWGKVCDLAVGISRNEEEYNNKVLKLKVVGGRESEDVTFHTKFDFKSMDFSETEVLYPEEDQERDERRRNEDRPW